MLNKRGAEESNVIIFVILALAVVGLVVFFSWNFFGAGSRLIDGNDPSVAIAVESCKYEIPRQPDAYCNSAHSVKIKGGGDMIVSCYFIDTAVRRDSLKEVSGKPSCSSENEAFRESQCELIKISGVDDSDWEKIIVDGEKCGDALKIAESEVPLETQTLPEIANILEFKGSGNFEVLSDEECRSGLEQRKIDLEIPDKLCYWEAMTEVYDEKCENLDRAQISEIFEKKAEYRKLNNADWPSLNTDGDFCVDVVYDCGEWDGSKKNKANTGGFFNRGNALHPEVENGIHINPYLAMTKEFAQNTILLHEGLHAVQNSLYGDTHVAEGEKYVGLMEQYNTMGDISNRFKVLEIQDQMPGFVKTFRSKENEIVNIVESRISQITSKDPLSEEDVETIEELLNQIGPNNLNVEYTARIPEMGVYESIKLEEIFLKDIKTPLIQYNLWDSEAKNAYNKLLELNRQAYLLTYEYKVKGYVGSKIEVDPRLSEVQRWWLEKTAPNCEIIYTPEKAKEVLDLFLAEKDLPTEYKWSQQDLGLLLYIYRGTEYEDDVYNDLINRLPGLALNTNSNADEMYA